MVSLRLQYTKIGRWQECQHPIIIVELPSEYHYKIKGKNECMLNSFNIFGCNNINAGSGNVAAKDIPDVYRSFGYNVF